jgi:2-oxoglutarate ferredoxin oxidoreductase subunit alpha
LLVDALASFGLHVFAAQSYMSRIRGGLNWDDIRISDGELFAGRDRADLLVALSVEAVDVLRESMADGGMILFDGPAQPGVTSMEFTGSAKQITGKTLMANSVAAGAIFTILGLELDPLHRYFERHFHGRGQATVDMNIACAKRGAELAEPYRGSIKAPLNDGAPGNVSSGSEAIALSAARSGVKFVTAYPMSPSTAVFTELAGLADEYGILVEQAEDEIAAVNMVCGATYAGVPAMTVTSGGGFALMVEGVALAGMLELPIVIMLGQRPGPATGLPTRTAQQDLRFAISAGHGEFPRAIFAPGTIQQAYELTRRSLKTAHAFQTPVILMTDQFIVDTRKNIPPLDRSPQPIDRCIVTDPPENYARYALTESGVSPRALPGSPAFVVCDSDEHTEDGHLTENLAARVRQHDKRMAKEKGLLAEFLKPEYYGPPGAKRMLIAWGSTYGPAREAVDHLNAQGIRSAMLHFAQVWPIDIEAVNEVARSAGCELKSGTKVISVEGNSTGQFASVLRQLGLIEQCELLLRYDGMPFTGDEIARRVADG